MLYTAFSPAVAKSVPIIVLDSGRYAQFSRAFLAREVRSFFLLFFLVLLSFEFSSVEVRGAAGPGREGSPEERGQLSEGEEAEASGPNFIHLAFSEREQSLGRLAVTGDGAEAPLSESERSVPTPPSH